MGSSTRKRSPDPPGRKGHAAGQIGPGEAGLRFRACPHCGEQHPVTEVFCPQTDLAVPGARDSFTGVEITGGLEVVRPLRRTGGSVLYKALDAHGRLALVKYFSVDLLPHETGDTEVGKEVDRLRRRFEREVSCLEKHSDLPFVPALLGRGTHRDEPYLVMEWIEGSSLRGWIEQMTGRGSDEEAVTPVRIIEVCLELASALRILHRRHLCHRDIKPDNVLVESKTGLVRIVDFGSAREYSPRSRHEKLTRGLADLPTTPRYLPPEVCAGPQAEEVDEELARKIDVYACSVVFLELLWVVLTGKEAGSDLTVGWSTAVKVFSPGLASKVETVAKRLSARRTARRGGGEMSRPATAAQLCALLEQLRSTPELAVEASRPIEPGARKEEGVQAGGDDAQDEDVPSRERRRRETMPVRGAAGPAAPPAAGPSRSPAEGGGSRRWLVAGMAGAAAVAIGVAVAVTEGGDSRSTGKTTPPRRTVSDEAGDENGSPSGIVGGRADGGAASLAGTHPDDPDGSAAASADGGRVREANVGGRRPASAAMATGRRGSRRSARMPPARRSSMRPSRARPRDPFLEAVDEATRDGPL